MKLKLIFSALLTLLVFSLVVISYPNRTFAHNRHECEHNCQTPTVSPTATPTPTPVVTSTPEPTEEPCFYYSDDIKVPCGTDETPVPTATPSATPVPEQPYHQPDGATAPTLSLCGDVGVFKPSVFYDGVKNNTFSYHWTTVKDGLHDYLVEYGFVPTDLRFSLIVHEEKVSITMFGGTTNWMRVSSYVEPGCHGVWSEIVN